MYAEEVFSLAKTDQSGITERAHLEQVWKSTGKKPDKLDLPYFPSLLKYIWDSFLILSQGRQAGMSGPQPLTYTDIKSWVELTGYEVTPFELEVIKKLDSTYIKVING